MGYIKFDHVILLVASKPFMVIIPKKKELLEPLLNFYHQGPFFM